MSHSKTESANSQVWLKPEQVERMRDAVYETGYNVGSRDEALITILYDTGLRRGEMQQVTLDLIDLDEGTLFVPSHIQKQWGGTSKTPPAVTIQLDPKGELRTVRTVRNYLNGREDNDEALIRSNKGGSMSGQGIYERILKAAEAAKIQPYSQKGGGDTRKITPHTLRHSLAYRFIRVYEDKTIYDVKNRLRHSSIQTTDKIYSHFDVV